MSDMPKDEANEKHDADVTPQGEQEARVSRRRFMGDGLKATAGAIAASMLMGENEAEAAPKKRPARDQRVRPFIMKTINLPWDHPANATLDLILSDNIQYPGRQEITVVPPPGNNVPARIPGSPVIYTPQRAMSLSPSFQALDDMSKRAVLQLYEVRHSYAKEHEAFRLQQHNALTGGVAVYPILQEKVMGKPIDEHGKVKDDAREEHLGYICKPAGNDMACSDGTTLELPYFAHNDKIYDMEGVLTGEGKDRTLKITLTLKMDQPNFSFGHMKDCKVYARKKNGQFVVPGAPLDQMQIFDGKKFDIRKGDEIHVDIPYDVLAKPIIEEIKIRQDFLKQQQGLGK